MAGKNADGTGKRGRAEHPDPHVCNDCKVNFLLRYKAERDQFKEATPLERRALRAAVMAPLDYMVQGSLWEWVTYQVPRIPREATICLDCLEKRLRRPLHPADFTAYPVNLENDLLRRKGLLECLVPLV